ncbi:hypothetical protein MNBD_GAMMA24-64 [hydrothermal vent metagenome]|uniref:HMA domain-containing protein n=1 Tax=hydrothermal vent metagenome TaxID=652676 RepID=A0A3B1BDZ5_9ZZZZ
MNVTELPISEKKEKAAEVSSTEMDEPAVKQVEVLIHTRDALNESGAEQVMQKLNHVTGVSDTRYSPAKNHLLIVSYNPRAVKPVQLLNAMRELGHQAQLVGL